MIFDLYSEENKLMTAYLTSLMMVRTVLFMGYSLDDPNIRQILYIIYSKLKTLRRQVYSFNSNLGGSNASIKFKMRGIKEINIGKPLDWKRLFLAIGNYWQNYQRI
jgi:hypothetical protein